MEELKGQIRLVFQNLFELRQIHDVEFQGQSLLELLEQAGVADTVRENGTRARLWIGERAVSFDEAATTYPAEASTVSVRILPGSAVAGAIAAFFAAIPTSVYVAAASIGAGILLRHWQARQFDDLAGTEPTSPAYSLTGGRNRAYPFGRIPVHYGDVLYVPGLASKPFPEVIGTNSFLRMVFILGLGEYEFEDFQIGDTSFFSFADATLQTKKLGEVELQPLPDDEDFQLQQVSALLTGSEGFLDATETFLNIPGTGVASTSGQWSIMLELAPQEQDETVTLFHASPGTGLAIFDANDILIQLEPDNTIVVKLDGDRTGGQGGATFKHYRWENAFPGGLGTGDWTQLMFTWHNAPSATSNTTINMYVNGFFVPETTRVLDAPGSLWFQTDDKGDRKVSVGMDVFGDGKYKGNIHQAALWPQQLTGAAIQEIWNEGQAERFDLNENRGGYTSAPPAHWWRFCLDNSSGGIGKDYGNGPILRNIGDDGDGITPAICSTSAPSANDDDTNAIDLFAQNVDPLVFSPPVILRDVFGGQPLFVRSTPPGTTSFNVTLVVNGLFRLNENQKPRAHQINVQFFYRRQGDEEFILFDEKDPIRQTQSQFPLFAWLTDLPPDTYDVGIKLNSVEGANAYTTDRNGTGADASQVLGDVGVVSINSFLEGEPFNCPGVNLAAIRLRADEQANGTVDNFNLRIRRKLRTWHPDTGFTVPVATRNPAWAALDIATGAGGGNTRPFDLENIDLFEIFAWSQFCDEKGLTFDYSFDYEGETVTTALNIAAAAGRAFYLQVGTQHRFIVDDPEFRIAPVQSFSARTISNLSISKPFVEPIHQINVPFPNRDKGFAMDVANIFLPGFDENNAEKIIEDRERKGITTFEGIRQAVLFDQFAKKFRPLIYRFNVHREGIVPTVGDKIRLNHLLPKYGRGSARVTDLTLDVDGNITAVTLDEELSFKPGEQYAGEFRRSANNDIIEVDVENPASSTEVLSDEVTFVFPANAGSIQVGDLFLFGEANLVGVDLIVTKIALTSIGNYAFECVDEAPEIQEALEGDAPEFTSQIRTSKRLTLAKPPTPVIRGIIPQILVDGQDTGDAVVRVEVDAAPGQATVAGNDAPTLGYFMQWRHNDDTEDTGFTTLVQHGSTAIRLLGVGDEEFAKYSADLPGANDYFHTTNELLSIADEWTVGMWVKPGDAAGSNRGIWTAIDSPGFESSIQIFHRAGEDSERLEVFIWDSAGTLLKNFHYDGILVEDEWKFLVFTWDGDTDTLTLYVNTVETAPDALTVDGTGTMDSRNRRVSYGTNSASTTSFVGNLRTNGVWSRVLSEAEIDELYDPGDGQHPWSKDLGDDFGAYSSSGLVRNYPIIDSDLNIDTTDYGSDGADYNDSQLGDVTVEEDHPFTVSVGDAPSGYRNLDETDYDLADGWTFSVWVDPFRVKGAPEQDQLFELRQASGSGNRIRMSFEGATVRASAFDVGGEDSKFYVWPNILTLDSDDQPTDDWLHLTLVYNGQNLRLFRNAEQKFPSTADNDSITMTNTPRQLSIGVGVDAEVTGQGDIHSLAGWNVALPDNAIAAIYHNGSGCDFRLAQNQSGYQFADNLRLWFRLYPPGVDEEDALASDFADVGQNRAPLGPVVNVSDDAINLDINDLTTNAPCGVPSSILSVQTQPTAVGAENDWITLPNFNLNIKPHIPEIRGAGTIDIRLWAVGPGGTRSEVPAFLSQVQIIGAGDVDPPENFRQSTSTQTETAGVRRVLRFQWDPPSTAQASDSLSYILKYNLIGADVVTKTLFTTFYDVLDPPFGDYEASVVAVDLTGTQSEPAELAFTLDPVVPIAPQKVTGLQQCGKPTSTIVVGDTFCWEWQRSVDVAAIGTVTALVPILSHYEVTIRSIDANGDFVEKGVFQTQEAHFPYDIGLNTSQGGPDYVLNARVVMVDTQGNRSAPSDLTLSVEQAAAVQVGGHIFDTINFTIMTQVIVPDPTPAPKGYILWAVAGTSITPQGVNVGEGNVIFRGLSNPIIWAPPTFGLTTLAIAAFSNNPESPDDMNFGPLSFQTIDPFGP